MLQRLYGVLLPFLVSFLIAYILSPLVDFAQNKCRIKNRTLAVLCTLLLVSLLLFGAVAALVPVITEQVQSAMKGLETYITNFDVSQFLSPEMQAKWEELKNNLDLQTALSYPEVQEAVKNFVPKALSWVSGGLSMVSELVVVFICFLYLLFLLIDFPDIQAHWCEYVPEKYREFMVKLVGDIDNNMNAYFRGQATVALCVGILFSIGFTIIGMPMGIAMGLIIGVLNLVPYMQALGIPPCILLCLVQSMQTGQPVWLTLLLMTIVFIVVQSLQDMVLTPKIMGKVTGLSPAAILLSLSIWGALMGVIGMIIALPLTTLLVSYYRYYVLKVSPEAEKIQAEVSTPTSRAITKAKTAINKLNKKRKRKSNP